MTAWSDPAPSAIAARYLRGALALKVPGCVFVMRKDGQPFADASFGWARGPWEDGGPQPMTGDTVIQIGSMTKSICAAAFIALKQDIADLAAGRTPAIPRFAPPLTPPPNRPTPIIDPGSIATTLATTAYQNAQKVFTTPPAPGDYLDLDKPFLPYLLRSLPSGFKAGTNVASITPRQLMVHQSGLQGGSDSMGNGTEPTGSGYATGVVPKASIDAIAFSAGLLALPATDPAGYRNSNYRVLGAIIEALTGAPFVEWATTRLFGDRARFGSIGRAPIDPSAYYYETISTDDYLPAGVILPDYTGWTGDGGYYVTGNQFTDWLYVLRGGVPLPDWTGQPLLSADSRDLLFTGASTLYPFPSPAPTGPAGTAPAAARPALSQAPLISGGDPDYFYGPGKDWSKNGGYGRGGGEQHGRFWIFQDFSGAIYTSFLDVNGMCDLDGIHAGLLEALRAPLTRRMLPIDQASVPLNDVTAGQVWLTVMSAGRGSAVRWPVPAPSTPSSVSGRVNYPLTVIFDNNLPSPPLPANTQATIELRAHLLVSISGTYQFRIWSDDGSCLWIDGALVAVNDGAHGVRPSSSFQIAMTGGKFHDFRISCFNAGGDYRLYVEWLAPQQSWAAIPSGNFVTGLG